MKACEMTPGIKLLIFNMSLTMRVSFKQAEKIIEAEIVSGIISKDKLARMDEIASNHLRNLILSCTG